MKTTLELPQNLLISLKVRAAQEGRSMKSLLIEILSNALGHTSTSKVEEPPAPYSLPLLKGKKATPKTEMTPERVAKILWGSEE